MDVVSIALMNEDAPAADDSLRKTADSGTPPTAERAGHGIFPQTRWTLVLRMQDPAATHLGVEALNQLCQIYWHPVYVYIRSWGKSPADSEDLTQGFFAMILSKHSLDSVAPEKGKLRTFLLVAIKRFLANAHHREEALKRGGGQVPVPIDIAWAEGRFSFELSDGVTPDLLFERQWALTILERAMALLRENYSSNGKEALFEAMKGTITPGGGIRPLAEIADDLGISEGAAKVAAHRLRHRYREVLKGVIGETVESEGEVDEEICHLLGVFSR